MLATSVISGLLVAFGGMTAVLALALTVLVLSIEDRRLPQLIEELLPDLVDGDMIFVSGTTGFDYEKMELASGVVAQCEQVLKNIEAALKSVPLIGQAAADKRQLLLKDVPPDFLHVRSGLGKAVPANVNILPALFEDEVKAVIELASLGEFTPAHLGFLEQLTGSIGVVLNTIEATMRTENLLEQSQQLTLELQTRQSELQQTNEELASKAKQLAEQNVPLEPGALIVAAVLSFTLLYTRWSLLEADVQLESDELKVYELIWKRAVATSASRTFAAVWFALTFQLKATSS